MAICKKCNQDLPEEKFGKTYYTTVSGEQKTHLKTTCMVCYRKKHLENPDKREIHRKGNMSWYWKNQDKAKNQRLRKYGITIDEYNNLRHNQNYTCAICGKHETEVAQGRAKKTEHALHVDHCHTSGKVRGLLCTNCNTVLGKCYDDTKILRSAITYLEGKDE